MALAHSWSDRTALSRSTGGFFHPVAGAGRFFARLGSAWREYSNLRQIESLPDDLRKDIGWPGGARSR